MKRNTMRVCLAKSLLANTEVARIDSETTETRLLSRG